MVYSSSTRNFSQVTYKENLKQRYIYYYKATHASNDQEGNTRHDTTKRDYRRKRLLTS